MDKSSLNTEILNCKPTVTKAKVHVIRDIRKKIGKLKKCKNEKQKEKKLKKAERLVEEIRTIKKLKVDEVMKFSLRTAKIEDVLQTPSNLKDHAYAVLAKHWVIKEKVESIRKRFDDWEKDLIPLLDMFEEKQKKKKKKKVKSKIQSNESSENGTEEKLPKDEAEEEKNKLKILLAETKKKLKPKKKKNKAKTEPENVKNALDGMEKDPNEKVVKSVSPVKIKKVVNESKTNKAKLNEIKVESLVKIKKVVNESKTNKAKPNEVQVESPVKIKKNALKSTKTKPNEVEIESPVKNKESSQITTGKTDNSGKKISGEKNNAKSEKKVLPKKAAIPIRDEERCDSSSDESDTNNAKEGEKVVDPFFVNKKILKPKIIDEDDQGANSEPEEGIFERNKFNRNPKDSIWNVKKRQSEPDKFQNNRPDKFQNNNRPDKFKPQVKFSKNFYNKRVLPEEELHPSWAAKKSVQPIIQPFQGKKIKFSDD